MMAHWQVAAVIALSLAGGMIPPIIQRCWPKKLVLMIFGAWLGCQVFQDVGLYIAYFSPDLNPILTQRDWSTFGFVLAQCGLVFLGATIAWYGWYALRYIRRQPTHSIATI